MLRKNFLIIGYLISLAALYFVFRNMDLSVVSANFKNIHTGWLILSICIAVCFRLFYYPFIWQFIFHKNEIKVSYKDVFSVNAVSLPLKFAMPFKISELVRAAGLKLFTNIDIASSFGSILLLKIGIIFATVILLFSGSFIIGNGNVMLFAIILIAAAVIFLMSIDKLLKSEIFGKKAAEVLHYFSNRNLIASVTGLAVIMQAGEIINTYVLALSLGAVLPLNIIFYWCPVIMATSMLPISVQGIGVRETITVTALGSLVSPEIGLSLGLLVSVVHHIIPAVLGGIVWVFSSTMKIFAAGMVAQLKE